MFNFFPRLASPFFLYFFSMFYRFLFLLSPQQSLRFCYFLIFLFFFPLLSPSLVIFFPLFLFLLLFPLFYSSLPVSFLFFFAILSFSSHSFSHTYFPTNFSSSLILFFSLLLLHVSAIFSILLLILIPLYINQYLNHPQVSIYHFMHLSAHKIKLNLPFRQTTLPIHLSKPSHLFFKPVST